MALEREILIGISLAGIVMTVLFVVIVNILVGRSKEEKNHQAAKVD
ncbi:MAG: hypothetical protein WB511_08350 [Nitrososphaeraceae archaeon]